MHSLDTAQPVVTVRNTERDAAYTAADGGRAEVVDAGGDAGIVSRVAVGWWEGIIGVVAHLFGAETRLEVEAGAGVVSARARQRRQMRVVPGLGEGDRRMEGTKGAQGLLECRHCTRVDPGSTVSEMSRDVWEGRFLMVGLTEMRRRCVSG